ncbi:matrixin family metalloprotease [Archangium gephyra]|uniref:matrixin family metalloprotease n=1 Tax=Archangium gephyra TaxID=48 RepID=UPI0035D47E76
MNAVALLAGFLSASSVSAYVLFIHRGPWTDNPYVIDVLTNEFSSVFGLDPARTMNLARASLGQWTNAGVGFGTNIEFYDTTPQWSDIEIEADTCCSGNCTTGCNGRAVPYPGSDDCSITIFDSSTFYSYTDDGGQYPGAYDIQSILAHELGHCIGLDHETSAPAIMNPTGGKFDGRFLTVDDKTGGQHAQYIAQYSVNVRDRTGGNWTTVGHTSGSVSVASRPDGWSMVSYETDRNADTTSNLARVFVSGSAFGPECVNEGEWTFDGVTTSQDTSGFAIAFLAANDSGEVILERGIQPTFGCPTGVREVLSLKSSSMARRRPSLAYDASTNRLVLAYIRNDTGKIQFMTSTGPGSWTNAGSTWDWSDTPIGLDCGYWAPAGANRCFFAVTSANGYRQLYIGEGYINSSGQFVHLAMSATDGRIGNVAPDIQIVNGNRLEIVHAGLDNTRSLYMYARNCGGGGCWDETYPLDRRAFVGPGISSLKVVTAGPP